MTKATEATSALTAQAFLNLAEAKQQLEPVTVPSIGVAYVLVMNVGQREAMQNQWQEIKKDPDNKISFSAVLLQATVCDASGDLILSSLSPAQINDIPYAVVDPLLDKSLKINGFLATAVEDARKN